MALHTKMDQRGSSLTHRWGEMEWQVHFSQEWLLHGWGMIRRHSCSWLGSWLPFISPQYWEPSPESQFPEAQPLILNFEASLHQPEETWDASQIWFKRAPPCWLYHGLRLLPCPPLAWLFLLKSEGLKPNPSPSVWWRKAHLSQQW